MSIHETREPRQKRSIEKKEKIIKRGFELIGEVGYYNTNTAQIAKASGVSTGIVYQYFHDKHDILMEGLKKYADGMFYPAIALPSGDFTADDLPDVIEKSIRGFIESHRVSKTAHEEIMAMEHSDPEVAEFFHAKEIEKSHKIADVFRANGIDSDHLEEKIHIMLGMVDNYCHEVIYHRHDLLDYEAMRAVLIDTCVSMITGK
ncbi:MAG: TetR/AcrR family transcriptional regulator [Eubacteriales bacterium]|nr:TetR/AcrR family transcriptional regulator [Eubacteriales bacterium]